MVKLLEKVFKRPVSWNEYQSKVESKHLDSNNLPDFLFFILAFDNTDGGDKKVERNSYRKYFLPEVNITNYNVLIDGRNFFDQPVNYQIKKSDEIRKTATGQRDDYTTGCLLDYQYFKDHYQLIAVDLSKQKELDADSQAIQQIEFYGMLKIKSQVCTVLEKSKETLFEFYKGKGKVM